MTGIEARLRDWKNRSGALDAERDSLVKAARASGMNIRQIGALSGLSRTTIYKILGITGQILADAKGALRGIDEATAYSRDSGRVWVSIFNASLGFGRRGELAATHSSEVTARSVIAALRSAGLAVAGDWTELAKGDDLEVTQTTAGNGGTGERP